MGPKGKDDAKKCRIKIDEITNTLARLPEDKENKIAELEEQYLEMVEELGALLKYYKDKLATLSEDKHKEKTKQQEDPIIPLNEG